MAGIEFGENNKVTVTMQNVESSGLPKTVFKGSRKPHQKECVLVIDHETGDITLERLTHNIIVKKIRAEGSCKAQIPRPITPSIEMNGKKNSPPFQSGLNISKPISPKPGPILHETGSQLPSLSSLSIIQNGSPSNTKSNKSSPINGSSFLINHKSPINQSTTLSHSISNLASLNKSDDEMIGILSDSSSDSSDHDSSSSDNSDSSSDDEVNDKKQSVNQSNGGHSSKSNSSESESDSNSDSDDDQINKSNKGTTYGSNVPNMPSMPKFSQLSKCFISLIKLKSSKKIYFFFFFLFC